MKSTETVEAVIEPSGTTFFMKYQHFYLGKNVKLIPKSVTLKRQWVNTALKANSKISNYISIL